MNKNKSLLVILLISISFLIIFFAYTKTDQYIEKNNITEQQIQEIIEEKNSENNNDDSNYSIQKNILEQQQVNKENTNKKEEYKDDNEFFNFSSKCNTLVYFRYNKDLIQLEEGELNNNTCVIDIYSNLVEDTLTLNRNIGKIISKPAQMGYGPISFGTKKAFRVSTINNELGGKICEEDICRYYVDVSLPTEERFEKFKDIEELNPFGKNATFASARIPIVHKKNNDENIAIEIFYNNKEINKELELQIDEIFKQLVSLRNTSFN